MDDLDSGGEMYILLGGAWCSIDAAPALVYILRVGGTYQINICGGHMTT